MLAEREKRGLHLMRGWPWSTPRHKTGGDGKAVQQFKNDVKVFNTIRDMEDRLQVLDMLCRRHQLQQTSARQLVAAMDDPVAGTPQWEEDLEDLNTPHAKACCPTQIIEDCFGAQKAHRVFKQANRVRRPMKSFNTVLKQHSLDKKHAWKTPPFRLASCWEDGRAG